MHLDVQAIRAHRPGNAIHFFETIDSTMRKAARLASLEAPHGTMVIAEEQTAGVGRLGRSWHSERESGIYCSILLRLSLPPSDVPIGTLMLGLATAAALEQVTDVACDLRWPNDVLINGKKVAGILAQLVPPYIVAGIGINVNHTALPADVRTPATSLRMERGGVVQSREDIIVALLENLDAYVQMIEQHGKPAIIRAFTAASSFALHRRVILEDSGQRGTTAGLDEYGFLRVQLDDGRMERVAAGGVRPEH